MDALLRRQELRSNPATRVPICLCLDLSDSMGRIIGGTFTHTGRKEFRDGQMWDIVDGGITAFQEMIEGVNLFYDNLLEDDVAHYSAEVCVITFSGDTPELVMDFSGLDNQEKERREKLAELEIEGDTPMGEAVNLALDRLDECKKYYKEEGIDYFQPWLVLMTDGAPNGSEQELNRAINRTTELVNQKKLTVFPIAIGNGADMNCLAKFSPKRQPLRLNETNFKKFFEWLSKSVERTSQSMPGDKVKLPPVGDWAEL